MDMDTSTLWFHTSINFIPLYLDQLIFGMNKSASFVSLCKSMHQWIDQNVINTQFALLQNLLFDNIWNIYLYPQQLT